MSPRRRCAWRGSTPLDWGAWCLAIRRFLRMCCRAVPFNTNWFAEHSATARRRRATDCRRDATRWIVITKNPRRRSFLRLPRRRGGDGVVRQNETGILPNEYRDDATAGKVAARGAGDLRGAVAL